MKEPEIPYLYSLTQQQKSSTGPFAFCFDPPFPLWFAQYPLSLPAAYLPQAKVLQ